MTSRIKAEITYNHPITVTKESKQYPSQVLFKSEGTPGSYTGEQKIEIDEWFSGDQVIVVKETPVE